MLVSDGKYYGLTAGSGLVGSGLSVDLVFSDILMRLIGFKMEDYGV